MMTLKKSGVFLFFIANLFLLTGTKYIVLEDGQEVASWVEEDGKDITEYLESDGSAVNSGETQMLRSVKKTGADVKVDQEWYEASATVNQQKVLRIFHPKDTWLAAPLEHRGPFMRFFEFSPLTDPEVMLQVQMMGRPVKPQVDTSRAMAAELVRKIESSSGTQGEPKEKVLMIGGREAVQVTYQMKGPQSQKLKTMATIMVVESSWFLLVYEAALQKFERHLKRAQEIIDTLRIDAAAVKKMWAASQNGSMQVERTLSAPL
ncbi:MAG: hypothetical protein JW893_03060 [Candidatus Omnitrophica bacterium]|nr:hypothetical protein [Candidatus Omnitrophota bacterium]